MKALIAIAIIVAAAMGGWEIYSYWLDVKEKERQKYKTEVVQQQAATAKLSGMVPQLEPILETAQRQGATGLRNFLVRYGKTINDPRLASIELDYVVLVAMDNPAEARKTFARVKQRIPRESPVHARIKQLEKTYQ
ncbi:MAG: hypothetical protein ABIR24_04200 [Verrucomicrobiota bacterium]